MGRTGRVRKAPVSSGSARQPVFGRLVLASAAVGSSIVFSLPLSGAHSPMSALWLGNAVQLAILLLTPRRHRVPYLITFAVLSTVIIVVWGSPVGPASAWSAANGVELLVALTITRGDRSWVDDDVGREASRLRFVVGAVVVGPVVGAVLGAASTLSLAAAPLRWEGFTQSAAAWYLADALAIWVLTPLMLWLHRSGDRRARLERPVELLVMTAVVAGAGAAVLLQPSVVPLLLLAVLLVALVVRHGITGFVFAMPLTTALVLGVTAEGWGPFHTVAAGRGPPAMVWAQAFVLVLGAVAVLIAALADERKRLREQEAVNERVYRLIAENSGDLIFVAELTGKGRYVSPAGVAVLDLNPDDLAGTSWRDLVHPADMPRIESAFRLLAAGAPRASYQVRMRHRDGTWRWFDTLVQAAARSAADRAGLVVGISRDITELVMRQRSLERINSELEHAAATDPLTGLPNRRGLADVRRRAGHGAVLATGPSSLLIIDVDSFKAYNEHYGHDGGDRCLIPVAEAITTVLKRPGDFAARYGGDEFIVLLPDTTAEGARQVAEELSRTVRQAKLPHPTTECGFVTVSVGVSSTTTPIGNDDRLLFVGADAALYRAKELGRDRVETSDASSPSNGTVPGTLS